MVHRPIHLRMAKSGDFAATNIRRSLHLFKVNRNPRNHPPKIRFIADSLPNNNSLYALDFIIANSGTPYFIEAILVRTQLERTVAKEK
jgi:hypothetical protein